MEDDLEHSETSILLLINNNTLSGIDESIIMGIHVPVGIANSNYDF